MRNKILLVAGVLGLEGILGCIPTKYPQYSGMYELQGVYYSDPSFEGEEEMPHTLDITDRMEHIGGHWSHHLGMEFVAEMEDQATGMVVSRLDNLSRIDYGTWPNDWYDGTEIHAEEKVYGGGAFCNYQYLYFLYLQTTPSVNTLQEVYPGRGKYIGKDSSTKMPLYESLANPEKVEFDNTKWYDAIKKNKGITLHFTFSRYFRSDLPAWEDGYKDCILIPSNKGEDSVIFTYHAKVSDLDDTTDIRKGGVEEIESDRPNIVFFKKIVSDIE